MQPSISEILAKVDSTKKVADKVSLLQKHYSPVLIEILRHAFDPSIKFLLPEGEPPYRPSLLHESQGALFTQARKLYLFVEGGHPTLTQIKREVLFIEFLETLDPLDAKLIIAVKDKKLPYKSIDVKLVRKAFPNFLPIEPSSAEQPTG